MGLHRFPLGGVERAGLIENGFGDAHFADVVQQPGETNVFDVGGRQVQRLRDHHRVGRYLARMALRVMILGVDGERERRDRLDHGGRQPVGVGDAALFLE